MKTALAAGLAPLFAAALQAQAPLTPAALSPCAWNPTEVEAALGLKVAKRESADMRTASGRDVGCVYTFEGSSVEISVRQIFERQAIGAAATDEKGSAETWKTIAGDPDGAAWKTKRADGPRLELTYVRGRVRTTVVVRGGSFRDEEMQPRLLRLRRVP